MSSLLACFLFVSPSILGKSHYEDRWYWIEIGSDFLIILTVFLLFFGLIHCIRKQPYASSSSIFFLFSLIVIVCAGAYIIQESTVGTNNYWLWQVVRAVISFFAAWFSLSLLLIFPKSLSITASQELQAVINKLSTEITQLQLFEKTIVNINQLLEQKIEERTAELTNSNKKLVGEVEKRKKIQFFLQERLKREYLVSNLSSYLLNLSADNLEAGIDRVLENIGLSLDVDCVHLYLLDKNINSLGSVNKIYQWCNQELQSSDRHLSLEHYQIELPWLASKIDNLEAIKINCLEDIPEKASAEKSLLVERNISSLLGIPIVLSHSVFGLLVINLVDQERHWKTSDIRLLNLIAEMLSNTLQRYFYQQELLKNNQELERSNQELEQFAYIASHDLQEPLRAINSFTELLAKEYQGKLGKEADEYIDFILEGGTRMKQLIKDLLSFSQVKSTPQKLQLIDSERVLKKVLNSLQIIIEEKNAKITFDRLPKLIFDELLFSQLLQNLIGNAIKFHSEKPPQIQISAETKEQELIFCISDNGIGIEPQYVDQIFSMFQRLHSRQNYPGSGIGLAICRKIVELFQGRIWVDSKPGKGSSFYFSIPRLGI